MRNNLLAIAPNQQAFNHAHRMELIPFHCKYAHAPQHIMGYHRPMIYVIDYGYRPNQMSVWGNASADKRRLEMLRIAETTLADITYVELP